MKKAKFYMLHMKIAVLFSIAVTFVACTKDFEDINTDSHALTDSILSIDGKNIGSFLPQMQKSIYYNTSDGNWEYQLQQNLNADIYSGYFGAPTPFNNGKNNTNYFLLDWNNWPFKLGMENIMGPWKVVQQRTRIAHKDLYAVALILKVAGMHRVTDIYGPMPYSKYGQGGVTVGYDSQKDIYSRFFLELDTAVTSLTQFVTLYPAAKPVIDFDLMYGGDYTKWIKWANSLRLRLAMRISIIDPGLAKTQAEKAISNSYGVFESNSDMAVVTDPTMGDPLIEICRAWGDCRMGANIESIMVGYNDPRLKVYFSPATDSVVKAEGDIFKGIRYGIDIASKDDRVGYSNLGPLLSEDNKYKTPIVLMTAAEVSFLKAEGVLRGWNMGSGTAQSYYEKGITLSFTQWSVPGEAPAYIADNISVPANYRDTKNHSYDINAVSTITIQWNEASTNEEKLERIITQKWLGNWPEGEEAWAEFRRTGYPKLFPMAVNYSNLQTEGNIDSKILIRRLPFSYDEVKNNSAAVIEATTFLTGGKNTAGTRLWWDVGHNF